jgi:hypothetical protein
MTGLCRHGGDLREGVYLQPIRNLRARKWVTGQHHAPAALPSPKTRYLLYRVIQLIASRFERKVEVNNCFIESMQSEEQCY